MILQSVTYIGIGDVGVPGEQGHLGQLAMIVEKQEVKKPP
jgi:hypothetical protein